MLHSVFVIIFVSNFITLCDPIKILPFHFSELNMKMALPTYWREAASVILVGRTNQPSGAESKVLMMKRSEKVPLCSDIQN